MAPWGPQTVRYRMQQVRELYGDRLTDPAVVQDLVVAAKGRAAGLTRTTTFTPPAE